MIKSWRTTIGQRHPGAALGVLILGLLVLGALVAGSWLGAGDAAAQPAVGYRLFGHDNGRSAIIRIDTETGLASLMGPTGFSSGASGMATALGTVEGPGGQRFAKGTFFGVLGDNMNRRDYVVVVDPVTGAGTKLVETSRRVSRRGIAFGPDGKTLYMIESTGVLTTVDTVSGAVVEIGPVEDANGKQYAGDNLEWDPDHSAFVSLMSRGSGGDDYVVQIDPADASATVVDTISGLSVCTLVRAPNPVPGPGGSVLPAGTWFTINSGGTLVTVDIDVAGGSAKIGQVIGSLGSESSGSVCGTAFTLPVQPPTPTPAPITPTAPPPADCVCKRVYERVPMQVIQDALANPQNYRGWDQLLDPGKPESPANPRRRCLSLLNLNIEYHVLWNEPVWRVGCQ